MASDERSYDDGTGTGGHVEERHAEDPRVPASRHDHTQTCENNS